MNQSKGDFWEGKETRKKKKKANDKIKMVKS